MHHGIIVDQSLRDRKIPSFLKILGHKQSSSNPWKLYRVEVKGNQLASAMRLLQDLLVNEKYYFHFYNHHWLIIGFKNKIFKITPDQSTWKEAVEYGRSLGIPEDQLDFYPSKFEEETY